MNLVTYQIAIESIELQIEECKRSKKQMDKVVKNSSDYWNTKIQDLKMAQDELAMDSLQNALSKNEAIELLKEHNYTVIDLEGKWINKLKE